MYDEYRTEERLTDGGTWKRRWKHWGGKGAIGWRSVRSHKISPFIRCAERHAYASRPGKLVESYISADLDVTSPSLRLMCFGRPNQSLSWLENF